MSAVRARMNGGWMPPWAMVVTAVLSVQMGAALAKQLFDVAGPSGVVFLRTALGAAMFYALWRPRLFGHSQRAYLQIVVYGTNIALMMLTFYAAISRIPLGVAVAIAFAGPLTISVLGSRRVQDLVWVLAAGAGIVLLSPFSSAALDPVGIGLAFIEAGLWAGYILLTRRINRALDGNTALTLSMGVAAVVALPFGIGGAVQVLAAPALVLAALLVALLSSAIPFGLEFRALKVLPSRVFGLLVSLEPVIATLIGFVVLHEALGLREGIGIALVTLAAVATARSVA
ncbi:MAG: EamA family transporter [Chloroflexi bacterium]|nr:EamA family transporter [Chloroflexota bacterium]